MPTPLVTILVPTFCRPGPLSACLKSIERAGLAADEIEILVCDNASPDETPQVVARHQTRHILQYVRRTENIGARRNIRMGAGEARGAWVLFLTDDDLIDATGVRILLQVIKSRTDVGFIFSSFRYVDLEGKGTGYHRRASTDQELLPSIETVSSWAREGWVLSRLAFRRDLLDLSFWDRHIENAYPSVLFAARSLLHTRSLYLTQSVVDHVVGNLVHWEEFGQDQYAIWRKTHLDYAVALDVVYADACITSCNACRKALLWRRNALRDFISVIINWAPGEGVKRLLAERAALAQDFRVPVLYVIWRIILAKGLRLAKRVRHGISHWLAKRSLRSLGSNR